MANLISAKCVSKEGRFLGIKRDNHNDKKVQFTQRASQTWMHMCITAGFQNTKRKNSETERRNRNSKIIVQFLVPVPRCKELGHHHLWLYNKKRLDQLKIHKVPALQVGAVIGAATPENRLKLDIQLIYNPAIPLSGLNPEKRKPVFTQTLVYKCLKQNYS